MIDSIDVAAPRVDRSRMSEVLPTTSGVTGVVDGIDVSWSEAGGVHDRFLTTATTEDGALRAAARMARPVDGYELRPRLQFNSRNWSTSSLNARGSAYGSTPHRLPAMILERGDSFVVVPTVGRRDGVAIANLAMPPVGTELRGGVGLVVDPAVCGTTDWRERARIVALTDGDRVARFDGAGAGVVEALDAATLRRWGGWRTAAAGAAVLGLAALAGFVAARD